MEIQPLRAFLAVARTGGFVKASEVLYRTQPAITSAIKNLEKEMGVALFERKGRRAILSPAGLALLEEAPSALHLWDGIKGRVLERLDGKLRGVLQIGGGETSILYLIDALKNFQTRYPLVQIKIHNRRAADVLRMLKAGELDVGVRSLTEVPPWAMYRKTGECARLAICAKKFPFAKEGDGSLASLARYPLLFPGTQSITRIIVEDALSRAGLPYTVGPEAGGWDAVKKIAMAGFGVAIVPSLCLSSQDRKIMFVKDFTGLFGSDHYGVIVRRGAFLSNPARVFIRTLDPKFPFFGSDSQDNGRR